MRRHWRHDPFAHCAISAPSPLLFAPSCHRPAFSPRRLRPLKRPLPRFAWPLSASREGFNITTYATGYAVPVDGFFLSLAAGRACPARRGLRVMFLCWPLRGMPRAPLAGARAARTPLCWAIAWVNTQVTKKPPCGGSSVIVHPIAGCCFLRVGSREHRAAACAQLPTP